MSLAMVQIKDINCRVIVVAQFTERAIARLYLETVEMVESRED